MQYPKATGLVTIGVCIVIALFAARITDVIRFTSFSAEEFVQLITPLFLIALFIERVLEVFISSWRAPGTEKLERDVKEVKDALSAAKQTPPVATNFTFVDQTSREHDLGVYKATTRRWTWIAGTLLGVIVAALGVRALGLFVDASEFADLREGQRVWFTRLDILLTGGVLAGGSDGLHHLVNTFTNFMKKSAEKAKS